MRSVQIEFCSDQLRSRNGNIVTAAGEIAMWRSCGKGPAQTECIERGSPCFMFPWRVFLCEEPADARHHHWKWLSDDRHRRLSTTPHEPHHIHSMHSRLSRQNGLWKYGECLSSPQARRWRILACPRRETTRHRLGICLEVRQFYFAQFEAAFETFAYQAANFQPTCEELARKAEEQLHRMLSSLCFCHEYSAKK